MFRQTVARNVRLFSTSGLLRNKGPVEGAKDAVKQVDKTVSDTIVKGIEKGGMSPSIQNLELVQYANQSVLQRKLPDLRRKRLASAKPKRRRLLEKRRTRPRRPKRRRSLRLRIRRLKEEMPGS